MGEATEGLEERHDPWVAEARWWERGVRMPQGRYLARVFALLGTDKLDLLEHVAFDSVGGNLARDPNTIGQALVRYRTRQAMSQKQMAALLEVHPGTLAKWEREYRTPTGEFLARVQSVVSTGQRFN